MAPVTQVFAVMGDSGIHKKCGDEFWQKVTAVMASHFKESEFTDAIIHGIEEIGKLLAEHFPKKN